MGKTRIVVAIFLTVLLAAVSFAQDKTEFQEKVEVTQRLTDVVVKDQQGNFVKGLKASDFQLFIAGKRVDIKSLEPFTAVSPKDERVAAYVKNLEKAKIEGGASPQPPTAPRYIILFFDRYNMGIRGVKATKESAKKILKDTLLPYDNVAVFEYNRTLKMLSTPTTDRTKILAAIDRLGGVSRNDNYRPSQEEIYLPKNQGQIMPLIEQLSKKEVDIKNYFTSIRGVVESLETLPGRKSYLLFSEGPNIFNPAYSGNLNRPSEYLAPTTNRVADPGETSDGGMVTEYRTTDPQARRIEGQQFISQLSNLGSKLTTELTKEYGDLESYVASTNSTLYTIRRGAVMPEWASNLTMDLTSIGGEDRDRFYNHNSTQTVGFMQNDRLESLREIARRTNGVFFDAGMSDEKLTVSLVQEIGNYYVLAFNFPQHAKKSFHVIEVKIPGKDYKVLYRKGIYDKKTYKTMTRAEKKMHLQVALMAPSSKNELSLNAQFFLMPFAGKNTAVYHFEIDPRVLKQDASGENELEMMLRVEDMEGTPLYQSHRRMIGKAGVEKLWDTGNVPFSPEGCVLVMTVRDNISGRISSTRQILKLIHEDKTLPIFTAPVILGSASPGSLKEWLVEELPHNAQIHEPLTYLGFKLPGMPNVLNHVNQGDFSDIFLMVGNLPKDSTDAVDNMYLKFYLDAEDGKSYRIIEKDSKIQFIKQYGAIIYTAKIPIGYGQTKKGNVRAVITGVKEDREFVTRVPYTIIDFSEERAEELAQSGEVKEMNSK